MPGIFQGFQHGSSHQVTFEAMINWHKWRSLVVVQILISIIKSDSVIVLLDPLPVTGYNITLHHQINSEIFILTEYQELITTWLPILNLDQSKLSYLRSFCNTFHSTLILIMYIASTLSMYF